MKIQFRNSLILGAMIVAVMFFQKAYAVSVPGGLQGDSQTASALEPAQKLKQADLQLRKIVSEIEQAPGNCKDCLKTIKAELEQVESQLSGQAPSLQEKFQMKAWMPARVIWALEEGSK